MTRTQPLTKGRLAIGGLMAAAGLVGTVFAVGWMVRTATNPLSFDTRPIDLLWWSPALLPFGLLVVGVLVLTGARPWHMGLLSPRAVTWGLGLVAFDTLLGYLIPGLHHPVGLVIAFLVGGIVSVYFHPTPL